VAHRLLRLVAAASILAFALTAGTAVVTYAATGDATTDPSATVADLPPVIQGDPLLADPPPPMEPPPTQPSPTEPPPANPEPPIGAEEPPPEVIDPPPGETVPDPSPTEAPVATDPPPADAAGTTATDPPADTGTTDPPPPDAGVAEVPPVDPVEPPAVEPPPDDAPAPDADPRESPVAAELLPGEEAPTSIDPAAEPSETTPITTSSPGTNDRMGGDSNGSVAVTARATGQRIALDPPPATSTSAHTESTSGAAVVRTNTRRDLGRDTAFDPAAAAGAGLAAGLAVTHRAPVSVAVAIEFGRVGGGWAASIVFNLWLRRQLRERQMSQRQLAALSGVDHTTISRLLREDRRPSLTTATKLVRALKYVRADEAEPEAAEYFERTPEESIFPARRVELALRADEQLDDDQVRRLMMIYLEARRRHEPAARSRAAPARLAAPPTAVPARAAPSSRR
jgi:transcriptional regulator with XRE-family HTH domain